MPTSLAALSRLVGFGVVAWAAAPWGGILHAAEPDRDAPGIQAFDPDYQPAEISVPDGYVVELAAAPPLVRYPTMADLDAQGRLFVAESSGSNLSADELLAENAGRILMLEDRDGDGRFDRSEVFAEDLTLPQGVLCYRGAVYVCSPPSLFRFEDTDGDGRADRREVLVDGFGFTGNAASVHGPFLAPSGRLFICQGRKPHELRDADGRVVNVGSAARIWSCRIDGTDLREQSGGGMDNPVEVDFTDDGQVLGTVNLLHAGPREDGLVHWLRGGVYPRADQGAAVAEFDSTGPLLDAAVHFGHVAVSGMTRYRGDGMGDALRDRWLVTDFNRGGLLRVTVERRGASFGGEFDAFLASDSDGFHPTDVLQDARGDVLLVDTGGWFRNGCPSSRYARPALLGAIYRIRPAGELRPWPTAMGDGAEEEETAAVVERLEDANPAVAREAMDRLALAGGAGLSAIERAWPRMSEAARMRGVWAVCRMASKQGFARLRRIAGDEQETGRVRTAALGALADHADFEAWDVAIRAVGDSDPAVAREAAVVIAALLNAGAPDADEVPRAVEAVWRRLATAAGDAALEHQLIHVLVRARATEVAARGLEPDEPPVRGRAALVVMRAAGRTPSPEDVLPLLESPDRATRAVATEVIGGEEAASDPLRRWAERHVARRVREGRAVDDALPPRGELLELLAARAGEAEWRPTIGGWLEGESDAARRLALEAIARGPRQRLPEAWREAFARLLDSERSEVRRGAFAALERLDAPELAQRLESIGRDDGEPLGDRVAAWRAAGGAGRALPDEGFQLLVDQLDPSRLSPERREAASILGQTPLSADQLQRLAREALPRLHPLDLPVVVEAFAASGHAAVGQAMLDALAAAPGRTDLALEQLDRVMVRFPEPVQRAAEPLREELRASERERVERLERLRRSLPPGDAARGAKVFASEEAACAGCHRVGAEGTRIGPDLTAIGRIRSTDDLLESIVLPNATIARDFETHRVLTVDGRLLAGLVTRRADGAVEVIGPDARSEVIPGEEVESITPSPVSVMPAGLDGELDEQQLSDLVAYLRSLDGAGD